MREVAESIGDNLNGFKVIVTKSTVPVGTGQMIERDRARTLPAARQEFAVVSNPEFLREGSAIEDFSTRPRGDRRPRRRARST